MSEQNNGGPAFPFGQTDDVSGQLVNGWGSEGMTLRDYFAAKAMQGRIHLPVPPHLQNKGDEEIALSLAKFSYEMADAMIEARG